MTHPIKSSFLVNLVGRKRVGSLTSKNDIFRLFFQFGFLLVFLLPSLLGAQVNVEDFKKIPIEDNGVPFNQFVAIVQDKEGFLWLSTYDELLRYDGYNVKIYKNNAADPSSLADNQVEKLFVDSHGDLWAGTGQGLSRFNYDCDCFTNYPIVSSPKSSYLDSVILQGQYKSEAVSAIAEDPNRQLWVATVGGDLLRYDRNKDLLLPWSGDPEEPKSIPPIFINVLLADQNHNLWIGGGKPREQDGSGLIRLNLTTGETCKFIHSPEDIHSLADSRVTALLEDRQGRLLVGTYRGGLHIYRPETDNFIRLSNNANQPGQLYAPPGNDLIFGDYPAVNILHEDQKGGFWIGTWGIGLYHFEKSTGKLTVYNANDGQDNSFVHNNFSTLFEDRQGQIWLGAINSGGLFRRDHYAPQFTWHPSLKRAQRSIESKKTPGTFWISSMGEGLHRLDRMTGEIKTYLHDKNNSNSLASNWVRAIYEDHDGILWLGVGDGGYGGKESGKGGLDRFDMKTGIFEHHFFQRRDRPEFNWSVYSLHEDQDGCLWLDTGPGGIYRSDSQKKNFEPYLISGSENSEIWLISDNNSRVLWATDYVKKIIYRYDPEKAHFLKIIEGDAAEAVLEDERGYWIPTIQRGLVHIDPNTGINQRFREEDGLPSDETIDIQSTEVGIYWVATRKGITKFNSRTKTFHNEGMPRGYFHPIWLKSKDGELFFGADEGLLSFYPENVDGNPIPPDLAFQHLDISGEPFPLVRKRDGTYKALDLSSRQNDFSITFVGLHFSDPGRNKYQYKLDPFDKDWINAGTRRTVQYTNLPPDDYIFQFKAANRDGVWTEEPLSLFFQIHPAWWKSWWFKLFFVLTIAGIGYWLYRFQLTKSLAIQESLRLQEINKLKTDLYQNITHEFRTPLTVILGMTQNLRSESDDLQLESFVQPLNMIERQGQNLLYLVNEMLDLAKIESGNLELKLQQSDIIPFVKYLKESFHNLANEKDIKINLTVNEQTLVMDFDPNRLAVVISNLLSNAIKFTPVQGEIEIRCQSISVTGTDFFSLSITDNGIGIAPEEIPYLFDRFYRTNDSVSKQYQGTGLGLALTKELVTRMKGSIEIESKPGHGSKFTVLLPICKKAPLIDNTVTDRLFLSPGTTAEIEFPDWTSGDSELPLVLIIEDHLDVAHYIGTCLQGTYRYIHALSGQLGIETAIARIPDLIICDVMMPDNDLPEMDGFKVCATLKQDSRTNHIPIILLTARVNLEDRLTGLKQGADAYLSKPFEKEELTIRLHQLLELRKTLQKKYSEQLFNDHDDEPLNETGHSFTAKAREIILTELGNENFSVDDLCRSLCLSRSQLHRKLKALTGMSTSIFIRMIRLQQAKRLLASTDLSISEIAYQVGFKTPIYFSQIFKETFGNSPSDDRK